MQGQVRIAAPMACLVAIASACAVLVGVGDVPLPSEGGPEGGPDTAMNPETSATNEGSGSPASDAPVDKPSTMGSEAGDGRGAEIDSGVDSGVEGGVLASDGSTQPWWPYINSKGCESAGVPLRSDAPATSDPGTPLPPIYLAMSRFRVGTGNDDPALTTNYNAWEDEGFDIDGVCTNSATCPDPTDPSMQKLIDEPGCLNTQAIPYDGNLCRDNTLGRAFGVAAKTSQVGQWFGLTEQDFNCELLRGATGVIFKISDYNGTLNDAQVRVDMYTALGLVRLPSWKCRQTIDTPLDPNWATSAPWLSTDPWIIDSRSIDISAMVTGNDLPNAKVNDTGAYVRNGWLVTHLLPDGAYFWFDAERTSVGINAPPASYPGFRSVMYRSVLAARLAKSQDGFWGLTSGTLGWVEPAQDVMQAFRNLGFCENMCQGYQQLKNWLDVNLDSITTAQPDQALPNAACDSLSAGWAFEARQATVNPSYMQPSTPPVDCPNPLSALAPRQGAGCQCEAGLGCPPDDAGAD